MVYLGIPGCSWVNSDPGISEHTLVYPVYWGIPWYPRLYAPIPLLGFGGSHVHQLKLLLGGCTAQRCLAQLSLQLRHLLVDSDSEGEGEGETRVGGKDVEGEDEEKVR